MYNIVITYSSANGHPGCFQFMSIVKKKAMNMDEQVSLYWDTETLGYMFNRTTVWTKSISSCLTNACIKTKSLKSGDAGGPSHIGWGLEENMY